MPSGDRSARETLVAILRSWPGHSGPGKPPVPDKLGRIQGHWLKVADIFHCYSDLIEGRHQERRGGPSIGKAASLVAANAKTRGTGQANLWKLWATYKDVAHLVSAATLICAEAHINLRDRPPGPAGLSLTQLIPFQMALLMPDLVLGVAMEFERCGLVVSEARAEPALDPNTLWRIPADINVLPVRPPVRNLRPQDIVILNNRRAGNRGRAHKTD